MKKLLLWGMLILVGLFVQVDAALANRSSTSIEGPTSAERGAEVILRVTVTHNANSPSHYTEWLKVSANKKEISRWEYSRDKRPEAAQFTKEIKMKVMEDTELVAEATCNIHGSAGPAAHKISVK